MPHEPQAVELDWIRQAQSSVKEAQRLLLSPNARSVQQSAPQIERAVQCVEALRNSLASTPRPSRELARELALLRREIARASSLLDNAAALYFGWARLLYATACGYDARGEPAAPGPVRRLSFEG